MSLEALEAETTVEEAEELLGTVQDYLDSSVISIIEDFSSLTEVWKASCLVMGTSESLGLAVCIRQGLCEKLSQGLFCATREIVSFLAKI